MQDANINPGIKKLIPIEDLVSMPNNTEVFGIDDAEIARLMKEFKENGFNGTIDVAEKDGRLLIISGHQRTEAFKRLGWSEIPCNIMQGLTDEQIHDKWISSNVNTRKLTPYRYYMLIKDQENWIQQRHIKGDKLQLIAERLGLSRTLVHRYRQIGNYPEELQKFSDDPTFPAMAALKCSKLDESEKYELNEKLKAFVYRNPNVMISADQLTKMIEDIMKKREYGDPEEDVDFHTGDMPLSISKQFDSAYTSYKQGLIESFEKRGVQNETGSVVDPKLDYYVSKLFEAIYDDEFMVMNNNAVRNEVRLMREMADIIEKKM